MSADQRERLREFIHREFLQGRRTVTDDEPLDQPGLIDSLGLIQVLAFIEKAFGISIDQSELILENFGSVNAIMRFIESKQGISTEGSSHEPAEG